MELKTMFSAQFSLHAEFIQVLNAQILIDILPLYAYNTYRSNVAETNRKVQEASISK